LIVLAVGLFAAEIKVPAYGLLTVSGIVAMILGAMMLVDTPAHEMQVSLKTVIPAALVAALWASVIVGLVLRAQRAPAVSGAEGMLGVVARAETELAPEGWVRLRGERWKAIANGPVAVGEDVTVTSVSGLTLHVAARRTEA
jgi:membrane-bound serine protease (ClpP class)